MVEDDVPDVGDDFHKSAHQISTSDAQARQEGEAASTITRQGVFVYNRYSLVADAFASVLRSAGLDVVGTATAPELALDFVGSSHPDLLVAGVETPPGSIDGLGFLRRVTEPPLSLTVIATAARRGVYPVEDILETGVAAFIDTGASREDVAFAIRQTDDRSIHLAERDVVCPPSPAAACDAALTARELEILRLASEGYSNGQVAAQLRITRQTVKFHLSNVYRKLDVANRTQAMHQAQLLHLVQATS